MNSYGASVIVFQRPGPSRAVDSIVLPSEGDAVVVGGDQTAIGYGYTMSVAREISQHLVWPGEGVLAVDHPLDTAERGQEPLEGPFVGQLGMRGEERQAPLNVGVGQHRQELASEQACEHFHVHEEVGGR